MLGGGIECFTEGCIESVSSEMNYHDKNLIEKVIRIFIGRTDC